MKKKISRKNLVKRLDNVFSLYIRLKDSDNEMVECFTCGKIAHFKNNMQCGHFQSRKFYATRWDVDNCKVQCKSCNVYKYGEQYKFGLRLDKEIGNNISEKLLIKSRKTIKYSNHDLQEMILYYNNLLNQLI